MKGELVGETGEQDSSEDEEESETECERLRWVL